MHLGVRIALAEAGEVPATIIEALNAGLGVNMLNSGILFQIDVCE